MTTTPQASYVLTASRRPTTWNARSAAVLGDVALAVGVLFAVILVPVLAIRGIAIVADLVLAALRGSG